MEKRSHDGPNTTSNNRRKRAGERDDSPPPPPPLDLILPEPTFSAIDLNKKSHAKKQPAGHIPRPRNAFILFRCDFVRQKKIPPSVEKDHRNISRIIGKIWQQMNNDQKEPWKQMADQEKINHHKMYPDYKFSVAASTKKKTKRLVDSDTSTTGEPEVKTEYIHVTSERASSCPPGAELVSQSTVDSQPPCYGDPLRTRDDLSRRPTNTVYYRSTPFDLAAEMKQPGFFSNPVNQHYLTKALLHKETFPRPSGEEPNNSETINSNPPGLFCGPRLFDNYTPITNPWNTSPSGLNDPYIHFLYDEAYVPSSLPGVRDENDIYSDSLLDTLPPLPRSSK